MGWNLKTRTTKIINKLQYPPPPPPSTHTHTHKHKQYEYFNNILAYIELFIDI